MLIHSVMAALLTIFGLTATAIAQSPGSAPLPPQTQADPLSGKTGNADNSIEGIQYSTFVLEQLLANAKARAELCKTGYADPIHCNQSPTSATILPTDNVTVKTPLPDNPRQGEQRGQEQPSSLPAIIEIYGSGNTHTAMVRYADGVIAKINSGSKLRDNYIVSSVSAEHVVVRVPGKTTITKDLEWGR